jgi:signal transduction histidine kinase/CheY-like chemotaxis protein
MPEHSKEFISTAMDCGEVLSNLINNVLDVSKIQAQMFQPAYSKAQPRAILHKVFSISKTICIRKGLTLFLEIDPNLPNFVLLDPGRLTQVLINLVSNSIKFTEEGYVKIKAIWNYDATGMVNEFTSEYSNFMCIKPRCALDEGPVTLAPVLNEKIGEKFTDKSIQTDFGESRAANHKESYSLLDTHQEHFICKYHNEIKGTLIIQVQDSGIGISDENCKKLFNPFTQANSAISKLYGGTGLGLWISKTILNVYKGSLSVKSRINEGSIFTIALPCSVFVSEEPCLPKNTLVSQKLDVLLLDNLYTKLNKIALEEQGVKVSVCISPIHATKYLDSCSFHFIFISINFLSDNLVSLMNRIKRIDEEKKSPIILLVPENKLDRIPLKFKNYSTLVSPLTQRDLNKVIHFMTEKTLQKNLGTVLVLDDDKFILDILSKILEKEKILHKTCSKGLEFIEIYKKNYKEVAVLVLDAHLEDVSGFEVAKIIREFEKTSGIASSPIICISGDNDESHLKKCSEAGITVRRNFYLVTKPVKREDYISTIKRYLK